MDLSTINGVVMDMDGVLWRGDAMLPGVGGFFDFLRARGLPFVLASNNSSKTPGDYVTRLSGMGVGDVREAQIVTSGTATLDYLINHYPAGVTVHVVGGAGLKALIGGAGFVLSDDEARVVVAGIDFQLTYDRLKRATYLIHAGADFIGTNGDVTFPMADGFAPGAGAILAALSAATSRQPLVIGKPNKPMFEAALRALGEDRPSTSPEHALMIGDRLDTDIQGAQQAGLRTALVLTGVTTREVLADSAVKPDGVYEDLPALVAAWDG